MGMEVKGMDAEEVLQEFDEKWLAFVAIHPDDANPIAFHAVTQVWLRHALAAHTAWLLSKLPEHYTDKMLTGLSDASRGYSNAVDDCRTVLQQEIIDLTK